MFEKCKAVLDWKKYQWMCEYDMCARADIEDYTPLCTMLSALAHACEKVGVTVDWQSDDTLRGLCSGIARNFMLINMPTEYFKAQYAPFKVKLVIIHTLFT